MSTSSTDIWAYSGTGWSQGADLTGFSVEALDGSIGKIDRATYETSGSWVVVDTGPWIFGKKVVLPAGVIHRIDAADETVHVNRTKDQIKNAPELDEDAFDDRYRDELGTYYGPRGRGWMDRTM